MQIKAALCTDCVMHAVPAAQWVSSFQKYHKHSVCCVCRVREHRHIENIPLELEISELILH